MIYLPESIEPVKALIQTGEELYLVGGVVRDALLNKSNKDVDLVCTGDARFIARRFADLTAGVYYMLDEERNTCRVITTDIKGGRIVYDFAQLRGGSLEADLLERDFTINAMAINLVDPAQIIDPLKGGRDLLEKWLRPCSETSFQDDPLRVMRAIRYSVNLDLKMEASTIRLLRNSVMNLEQVSKERKRDELFKILENKRSHIAFELLHSFGIFPLIGIERIPDFERAHQRLRVFETFTAYLLNESVLQERDYFTLASFISGVNRHRKDLDRHLNQQNSSDRSLKGLDGLAAFLFATSESEANIVAEKLSLSNDERVHLTQVLKNAKWLQQFISNRGVVDNRIAYQYFKQSGISGLDLMLLFLADISSVVSAEMNNDFWLRTIKVCEQLLNTWFEHPDVINPKMLLTGTDLLFEFDLAPGPLIGQLLENLREEQAAGKIITKREALDWVEGNLTRRAINKE